MVKKYEVPNQVTGISEEAATYEEALTLRTRIQQDYLELQKGLFTITVLEQLEDGSWRQGVADENGNMVLPPSPFPSWVWNAELFAWKAPVPKPVSMDGTKYLWNEETQSWYAETQ